MEKTKTNKSESAEAGDKKVDAVQKQRSTTHDRIMNVVDVTGKIVVGSAEVIGYGAGATVKAGIKATQGLIRGLSA